MKSSQVFQGGAGEKAGVRPGYVFQTLQGAGLLGDPPWGPWGLGKMAVISGISEADIQ